MSSENINSQTIFNNVTEKSHHTGQLSIKELQSRKGRTRIEGIDRKSTFKKQKLMARQWQRRRQSKEQSRDDNYNHNNFNTNKMNPRKKNGNESFTHQDY